jgi:hypothetical protein
MDLPLGVPIRSELVPKIKAGLRALSVTATKLASRPTSSARGLYSTPTEKRGWSL